MGCRCNAPRAATWHRDRPRGSVIRDPVAEFGALIEEVKFASDSPLEEAVSSETVSAPKFPANRAKYRELQRLAPDQAFGLLEKASILNALRKRFPGEANRESPAPYQGTNSKFGAGSGNCPVYVRGW